MHFPFPFALRSLLTLLSLSTLPLSQSIPTTTSLNAIIPHCFFPGEGPDLQPANLPDCNAALRLLIAEPGFRNSYRFSRNQRIGVRVPKWWRSGECIILVSCANDFDSETFSYKDVLMRAKNLVDQCVNVTQPLIPWGGVDVIGTHGSFFVAVNGRLHQEPLESTNLTLERGIA